jgi:hypothetical protein
MTKKRTLLLLAMLGLLILSALQDFLNRTFLFDVYSVAMLFELIFTGMVTFLVWLILVKPEKDALVG